MPRIRPNWLVINPHQGLGDHILCNGIYRESAKKYSRVLISVKRNYYRELSNMLRDLENITYLIMPNTRSWTTTRLIQFVSRLLRFQVLGLGSYGSNFFPKGVRFDNNFYNQADLDFKKRWESFKVPRNPAKELELFEELVRDSKPYIFLHEDASRNFRIDRGRIPNNLRIIQPTANKEKYFIVDYRLVIENASEIHVIESSFAAFIESIPVECPLYAHRYARHHALNDFRHEFTYKKAWKVLLASN